MNQFSKERIAYLFQTHAGRTATAEEEQEFARLIQESGDDPELETYVKEVYDSFRPGKDMTGVDWQTMFNKIVGTRQEQTRRPAPVRRLFSWPRMAAAAVLLGLLGTGAWLLHLRNSRQELATAPTTEHRFSNDIPPGGNKAILILAGGKTIILDSAHTGTLATQGDARIRKLDSGQLAYTVTEQQMTDVVYNTLQTPRGGQYKLILPDGTGVWLNAASSLTYPTSFTGKNREVALSGEAYFEVAQDTRRPFKVTLPDGQQVDVLGTHFNINAYPDEAITRTTLLEGSVKVVSAKGSAQLEPGQQALVNKSGQITKGTTADPGAAIAWKEGRFEFNGNIQAIMRQMARWYDVDVVYEGDFTDKAFGGAISRKENISEVLKFLALTGTIHFNIEKRKVTVMK